MGGHRTAVLMSLVLVAACGGKLTASSDTAGSDPTTGTTGSTGTTTGGVQTTTGTGDPGQTDPGEPLGAGGSPAQLTPCGPTLCAPGLVCCNESCGICVEPSQGCRLAACPVAVDAGAGGIAGGPIGPNEPDVVSQKSSWGFQWRDSWFITGCQQKAGHDCINIASCPNLGAADFEDRGAVIKDIFPLGGQKGTTYAVSFTFHGISEGKYYTGGKRDAGDGMPANLDSGIHDTFYVGGTPMPSIYNVMRMRVLDSNMKEVQRYYMNSFPQSSGAESHRTFLLGYSKTIAVPGGGFVEYMIEDSNCHAIDNCGQGNVSDTVCNAAQNIPNEPTAMLPALYMDPGTQKLVPLGLLNSVTGASQPWHAQASHLTITSVVAIK